MLAIMRHIITLLILTMRLSVEESETEIYVSLKGRFLKKTPVVIGTVLGYAGWK